VEFAARNREGGFWVAMNDPNVVDHAVTWSVPRTDVRRFAALSDGAARIVDAFAALDWAATLDPLASEGPSRLISRVRAEKRADPAAMRWPRNKISDDATPVYVEFLDGIAL